MLVVALGSFNMLIQMFAVGMKLAWTSTKIFDGGKANPRIGSSSAPVAKRIT